MSLFMSILDSKSIVNSSRYTAALFWVKTRSNLRELPVIKHGDGKEGRSAYNELSFNIDRVLEIYEEPNYDTRCTCLPPGRTYN